MEKICSVCGNKFFIESLKIRKKYCSNECFNKYYVDYRRKYAKEYNKKNRVPGTEYYKKHLDYNRQYLKKYNQLESTKEKKDKFSKTPERKEYLKQWHKEYRKTTERKEYLKQYMKEYSKKPEVIEKRKKYLKEYLNKYYQANHPLKINKTAEEIKTEKAEWTKNYLQRPERKEYLKQYLKSDIGHSKFMATQKKYKQSVKGKLAAQRRYLKYKDKIAEYHRQRVLSGKSAELQRKYRPNYIRERRKNDQSYRLILNLRARFKSFLRLKNLKKNNSTMTLIGCSPKELKDHIQKQFKPGMSWDNYGLKGWHVDHIKPLSLAKSMQEIIDGDYMHYTNFQPLWATENISKGKKYNDN